MDRKFLSRKELAYALGKSISTVNRGIRDGLWPYNAFVRIGPRQILYPQEVLEELKAQAFRNLGTHIKGGESVSMQ